MERLHPELPNTMTKFLNPGPGNGKYFSTI
jgi:hypothetical protein